jgi:hypothetical protein
MKLKTIFALITLSGLALSSYAQTIIVNDTWADVNRTSSGPDGSGIDSRWFSSSGASSTVPAAGDLRNVIGAGSQFNTTYFPSAISPYSPAKVTLANPGDSLRVTWQFAMTGVNLINANQNFLVAVANTPTTYLTTDASPALQIYSGYATFMNVGQTLSNSAPFSLKEWINPVASSLLGHSASWGANGVAGSLANTGVNLSTGFESGITYTYMMLLTLGSSGNLQIDASITGGTLLNGGAGFESVSYNDATPNSLTYDTFAWRVGTSTATASQFDTSLFKVEFTSVPEPATFALAGLGLLGFIGYRRMRR